MPKAAICRVRHIWSINERASKNLSEKQARARCMGVRETESETRERMGPFTSHELHALQNRGDAPGSVCANGYKSTEEINGTNVYRKENVNLNCGFFFHPVSNLIHSVGNECKQIM